MTPRRITAAQVLERYDGFLVDAYGVLVHGSGPLPFAAEFLSALAAAGKPWVVLSNDASRLPETAADRYRGFGLPVTPEHMVTSGSLLGAYFERAGLGGAACIVLGPADSHTMVERAGGRVVAAADDSAAVVVVCDDGGYPFLPTVEAAISATLRRLDRGDTIHLVLPNPDLTYPKAPGEVGLTSGSVAMLVEAALQVRLGPTAPRFVPLGKPHPLIFEAGSARLGLSRHRIVMLGDQLGTDIAGAVAFGLESALVGTGLSRVVVGGDMMPTWALADLDLRAT